MRLDWKKLLMKKQLRALERIHLLIQLEMNLLIQQMKKVNKLRIQTGQIAQKRQLILTELMVYNQSMKHLPPLQPERV